MDLGRSMFRDLASAAQTNLAAAAQSVNTAAQSAATNVKGSTTRELLQRIEDQDMELLKYKKRTRDLVHSYKSLIEEKKKLEQTLEAFNNVDPMAVAVPVSEKTVEPSKSAADIETSPSKKSPKRLKKGKLGTRILKKPEDEATENQNTQEKLQLTADNFPLPETDTETNQSKPISDDNALYKNYQSDKEDEKDGDNNNTHYKEQFHLNQQQLSIMSKQIKALKTQLTDALSSSSKQKEAFLTDKKIMKNDYETKIKKLESKVQASDENFKITSDQLKNIKEQLRLTITEKEKTSDQLTKLRRESQTEILNYKKKISDLEHLYEKEKSAKIEINAKIAKDDGENLAKDEMLTRYKQELKDTLDKLKVAEEKLSKPDEKMTAQIKHLREELEYRKNDYFLGFRNYVVYYFFFHFMINYILVESLFFFFKFDSTFISYHINRFQCSIKLLFRMCGT